MNIWDKFKAKYASFDSSGKLITVLFFTTLTGWILARAYEPAYMQFVVVKGFLPALFQPWSWITYGFLHEDLWHFVGNAFGIYIAGRYILNLFQTRQFLSLFFMGVLAGSVSFVLTTGLIPSFFRGGSMIGASAGVFALIFFACTYFPDSEYRLIFFNIKLKYIGYFFLSTNLLMVVSQVNTGGSLAHLAGAAVGYYVAIRMKAGIDVLEGFAKIGDYIASVFKSGSKKPRTERAAKMKTVYKGTTSRSKTTRTRSTDQEKVDAILDKISSSGYESLSKSEKDYLFKAGKD